MKLPAGLFPTFFFDIRASLRTVPLVLVPPPHFPGTELSVTFRNRLRGQRIVQRYLHRTAYSGLMQPTEDIPLLKSIKLHRAEGIRVPLPLTLFGKSPFSQTYSLSSIFFSKATSSPGTMLRGVQTNSFCRIACQASCEVHPIKNLFPFLDSVLGILPQGNIFWSVLFGRRFFF